jgi:hypothetical protein
MNLLTNGHSNMCGMPVRVYPNVLTARTICITGNLAGATVTVERSPDMKNWESIENLTNVGLVSESITPINGWLRARITGGVAWKKKTPAKYWMNSCFYNKGDEWIIDNKIYRCNSQHLDGMTPSWDFWDYVSDYTPEAEPDNEGATNINVFLM